MAYTDFYCDASAGSNVNAGSTTSGTPVFSFTGGNWDGTSVYTAAGQDLSAVTVGMFASIYIDGATVAVFVSRITAVDNSAKTITVSTTAKSGTAPATGTGNRSIKVGGVWKGPNGASDFPCNFVTSALTNASADPVRVNLKNNSAYACSAGLTTNNASVYFAGYSSTPGDQGIASITFSTVAGAGYTMWTVGAAKVRGEFIELIMTGATSGSAAGFSITSTTFSGLRLRVAGSPLWAFDIESFGASLTECEAYNNNTRNLSSFGAFNLAGQGSLTRCIAHDNKGCGFSGAPTGGSFVGCIADRNSLQGFASIAASGRNTTYSGCASYNNGTDGFYSDDTNDVLYENCVSERNGGYGFKNANASQTFRMVRINCKTSNNTSGATLNFGAAIQIGNIDNSTDSVASMTGTRPTTGDFTATGAAQAAGRGSYLQSSSYYTTTTTASLDIGIQHQSTGGGGSVIIIEDD